MPSDCKFMPYNQPIPDRKQRGKAAGGLESLVQAEKLLQIAFVLPSAMVIGWLAGAWADLKLHRSWLTVAGVIFGCVAGLFYVVQMAIQAEKNVGRAESHTKRGDRTDDSQ